MLLIFFINRYIETVQIWNYNFWDINIYFIQQLYKLLIINYLLWIHISKVRIAVTMIYKISNV